jgi:hypothetical protein
VHVKIGGIYIKVKRFDHCVDCFAPGFDREIFRDFYCGKLGGG